MTVSSLWEAISNQTLQGSQLYQEAVFRLDQGCCFPLDHSDMRKCRDWRWGVLSPFPEINLT
jgi:hypothetical protein